jgi:diguanylate cyclase (GGDEF)-like protein
MSEAASVLIVDDDESTRRTAALILGTMCYAVETAATGHEAIEKAKGRFFNVALVDIKLPDMEGVELLAPLREIHPTTAVIVITAHASVETAVWALNGGATAYIMKPLNMHEVLATIKAALERQRLAERKRKAQERLAYMATHDPLTGLPNRPLFKDRLTLALTHAKRDQQRLAVMLLDLDHFKDVNDALGHTVGDELLQVISARLRMALRQGDTVARIGGDEFLLLLPGIVRSEDAARIAEKILEAVHQPLEREGRRFRVTVSIGIAIYPEDGDDADTLMRKADEAMYGAKKHGRNNYQHYSVRDRRNARERAFADR